MAAAKRAEREPMSKVDTAWLRMESPSNLMMITGVLIFRDRLDVAKVRKLLARALAGLSPFPSARGRYRERGVLGNRFGPRHGLARPPRRAAGQGRQARSREMGQRQGVDCARSCASALAVPCRRQLRARGRQSWQRPARTHPSLLRGRSRPRAGDAVAHRCRAEGKETGRTRQGLAQEGSGQRARAPARADASGSGEDHRARREGNRQGRTARTRSGARRSDGEGGWRDRARTGDRAEPVGRSADRFQGWPARPDQALRLGGAIAARGRQGGRQGLALHGQRRAARVRRGCAARLSARHR